MRTEIKDGQRVWSKDSIETILKCSYKEGLSDKRAFQEMSGLISEAMKEIGVYQQENLDRLVSWEIKTDKWCCSIKLIKPIDSACFILIDLDKYEIEDLIYLWDNIRSSWLSRQD